MAGAIILPLDKLLPKPRRRAKPKALSNPRVAAAVAVSAVLERQSLTATLASVTTSLSAQDASLVKALAYGVCRFYFSLAQQLEKQLKKPLRQKDQDVYALLLVGAYQLRHLRQPSYAAIDSAVTAAKSLGKPWAVGLVNAILRGLDAQPMPKPQYEHPDWLIASIRQAYPDHYAAIFDANNQPAPYAVRANLCKTTRPALQQQLKSEGINSRLGELSQAALYLEDKPKQLTKLDSFAEGLFSVQDEAPQLCAPLLDLQPGQRVLDACAAPGGKTGHILEAQQDLASLLAVDLEADRLQRVAENLARLQLSARLVAADIADLSAWYDGQPFDRILCDAPCSATGVIRRHPDIKLLRQAEDIDMLAQQQLQILLTLWQCLAPGGILLYATCSILPQENDAVIAGFIAQQPAVKVLPITLPNGLQTDYGWQLLPDHRAQDGFYYARLQKPC